MVRFIKWINRIIRRLSRNLDRMSEEELLGLGIGLLFFWSIGRMLIHYLAYFNII